MWRAIALPTNSSWGGHSCSQFFTLILIYSDPRFAFARPEVKALGVINP